MYIEETEDIEHELATKQNQCLERTGKYSSDKLNESLDRYADDTFEAVWNLLSRIGKLPQKSEISEDD
jgi:hypothetical protein